MKTNAADNTTPEFTEYAMALHLSPTRANAVGARMRSERDAAIARGDVRIPWAPPRPNYLPF